MPTSPAAQHRNGGFNLNCYDANRKSGTAKIIVTGGTFVNFDPSNCKAEGENTNFVADGYGVVATPQANGDVWYTVVKGTGVVPSTQESLNDGIKNSTNKDVTVVMPASSTYTLTINGITVNGFANGQNTGPKLWANKNSMDATHLSVTIDGTKIQ